MTNDLTDWFDIVILILVMSAGMLTVVPLTHEWNTPILSVYEDKTVVDANNLFDSSNTLYGKDILSMLMVADQQMGKPAAIKINESPIINIDSAWCGNRDAEIEDVLSRLGVIGLRDKLSWTVTSVNFVDTGLESYWHYTLEEVPDA